MKLKKQSTFERFIFPAILTVVAAFAFGCGGGSLPGVVNNATAQFKHLTTRAASGSHIYSIHGEGAFALEALLQS